MEAKRKLSTVIKLTKKKNWVAQESYDMILPLVRIPSITLGVTAEEYPKSTSDRLLRKKYMGMWRREFRRINPIIPRFPSRVLR
jgi:hypothetical protein